MRRRSSASSSSGTFTCKGRTPILSAGSSLKTVAVLAVGIVDVRDMTISFLEAGWFRRVAPLDSAEPRNASGGQTARCGRNWKVGQEPSDNSTAKHYGRQFSRAEWRCSTTELIATRFPRIAGRREKADWRTGFAVEVWAARGTKRSKWRRVPHGVRWIRPKRGNPCQRRQKSSSW